MSNAVFPSFTGLKWGSIKAPIWRNAARETPSMREYRTRFALYPRYLYKLSYEVLREKDGFTELQQLIGFFNLRNASFDTFLFTDPDDNAVVLQGFGVGNASTVAFQLAKAYGGFTEPVYDVNGTPSIYLNGVLQSSGYSISASGLVTFTTAPGAGVIVAWTGSYYFRVRFKEDSTEFAQFLYKLWEARRVDLITCKP